jgi:hypothetical protein
MSTISYYSKTWSKDESKKISRFWEAHENYFFTSPTANKNPETIIVVMILHLYRFFDGKNTILKA